MIQQTLNEDSQKKYTMKIVSTDAAYILFMRYFRPHGAAGDVVSCAG